MARRAIDRTQPQRFRPLTEDEARAAGFGSAAGIEVSETATFDDVVSSGPFKLFKRDPETIICR